MRLSTFFVPAIFALSLAQGAQAQAVTTTQGAEPVSADSLTRANESLRKGKYVGLDVFASYDIPHYTAPTGTSLDHQGNALGAVTLYLLDHRAFSWTYKRTGEDAVDRANAARRAARIMEVQLRLSSLLPSVPLNLVYYQHVYNTEVTVGRDRPVFLVTADNVSAARGSLTASDPGVIATTFGDKLGLKTVRERFEARYVRNPTSYVGVFVDELKKPWEDPGARWTDAAGRRATVVYGDTRLRSVGVTFGQVERAETSGWSLSSLSLDLSKTEVDLTNNFSFSDRFEKAQQDIWKWAVAAEVNYRFQVVGARAYVGGYWRIDSYKVHRRNSEAEGVSISNDRVYGIKLGVTY